MLDRPNTPSAANQNAPLGKPQIIGRQAVVDIGSNSVRLVIYDGPKRAPMPICNEKALCGLGRDMKPGGKLNPEAVDYALTTLQRFRRIIKETGDPITRIIATISTSTTR